MVWLGVDTPDPMASPKSVRVGDISLLLVHAGGRWWAIEDLCSHARCAFSDDGEIDDLIAICNCHGSEFDVRTGAVLRSPANRPIRTIPVRELDGSIEVDL